MTDPCIRNPILVSYISKGILPYRGIGSGIRRALDDWPDIDFLDDHEETLFTVTVYRKPENGSGKSSWKILQILTEFPNMTIPQLAEELGVSTRAVEKQIAKLRQANKLERIGPARGGHWQVKV